MNSKLTRDQLRERAQLKAKNLTYAISQSAFAGVRSELEEELQFLQCALACLEGENSEPVAWTDAKELSDLKRDGYAAMLSLARKDCEHADPRRQILLFTHPAPSRQRDQIRQEHAEWSQATFGNVGPVGPLKHLSKEALEAAEQPGDLSEWADMQFLLWDAQRRAGITDEQITQAMIDKLAVNKQREWPEPKDGEPRLHIKEQPAPVVQKTAHSSVIAEQLANVLSEMKVTDHQRAVISCAVDRLNNVAQLLQLSPSALLVPEILDYQGAKELYNYLMTEEEINATVNAWNACRAAMLQELKKSAGTEAICRSNENVQAVEVQSLTSINPAPDLVSLQKKAESIIGNYPGIPDCWCCTCRPVVLSDMRFVVCPDCGNKRCPRANDHRNACTGSNEPGQEGSAYQAAPQLPGSEPAAVPGK